MLIALLKKFCVAKLVIINFILTLQFNFQKDCCPYEKI